MSARSRNPLAGWIERRERERHTAACVRRDRINGGRFAHSVPIRSLERIGIEAEVRAYLDASDQHEVRGA